MKKLSAEPTKEDILEVFRTYDFSSNTDEEYNKFILDFINVLCRTTDKEHFRDPRTVRASDYYDDLVNVINWTPYLDTNDSIYSIIDNLYYPWDEENRTPEEECKEAHDVIEALTKNKKLETAFVRFIKRIDLTNAYNEVYTDFIDSNKSDRHFIIHVGPTNSGKTYSALERLSEVKHGIYAGPLRMMAHEVYEKLNARGVDTCMITGEMTLGTDEYASHTACTIAMLDYSTPYDVLVLDEAQLVGNDTHGHHYTKAILEFNASEIHICTVPNAVGIIKELLDSMSFQYEVIYHERMSELIMEDTHVLADCDNFRKGDVIVTFSRGEMYPLEWELTDMGYIVEKLYGAIPYEIRTDIIKRFADGKIDILVTTDVIGMGVNIPCDRIIFASTTKFDGCDNRELYPSEILQIAGRAGRGTNVGYVTAIGPYNYEVVYRAMHCTVDKVDQIMVPFVEIDGISDNMCLFDIYSAWSDIDKSNTLILRNQDMSEELFKLEYLEYEGYTTQLSMDHQKTLSKLTLKLYEASDRELYMGITSYFRRLHIGTDVGDYISALFRINMEEYISLWSDSSDEIDERIIFMSEIVNAADRRLHAIKTIRKYITDTEYNCLYIRLICIRKRYISMIKILYSSNDISNN